jgi:signal transduction histidine kinase
MKRIGGENEDMAFFSDKTMLVNIVYIYMFNWMTVGMIYLFHGNQTKNMKKLNELLEISEESTRTKDFFIAAISHEFRNPLNSIICSIDVLQHETQDFLPLRQRSLVKTIQNSGEILLNLINNVLDVSKL